MLLKRGAWGSEGVTLFLKTGSYMWTKLIEEMLKGKYETK